MERRFTYTDAERAIESWNHALRYAGHTNSPYEIVEYGLKFLHSQQAVFKAYYDFSRWLHAHTLSPLRIECQQYVSRVTLAAERLCLCFRARAFLAQCAFRVWQRFDAFRFVAFAWHHRLVFGFVDIFWRDVGERVCCVADLAKFL